MHIWGSPEGRRLRRWCSFLHCCSCLVADPKHTVMGQPMDLHRHLRAQSTCHVFRRTSLSGNICRCKLFSFRNHSWGTASVEDQHWRPSFSHSCCSTLTRNLAVLQKCKIDAMWTHKHTAVYCGTFTVQSWIPNPKGLIMTLPNTHFDWSSLSFIHSFSHWGAESNLSEKQKSRVHWKGEMGHEWSERKGKAGWIGSFVQRGARRDGK